MMDILKQINFYYGDRVREYFDVMGAIARATSVGNVAGNKLCKFQSFRTLKCTTLTVRASCVNAKSVSVTVDAPYSSPAVGWTVSR